MFQGRINSKISSMGRHVPACFFLFLKTTCEVSFSSAVRSSLALHLHQSCKSDIFLLHINSEISFSDRSRSCSGTLPLRSHQSIFTLALQPMWPFLLLWSLPLALVTEIRGYTILVILLRLELALDSASIWNIYLLYCSIVLFCRVILLLCRIILFFCDLILLFCRLILFFCRLLLSIFIQLVINNGEGFSAPASRGNEQPTLLRIHH